MKKLKFVSGLTALFVSIPMWLYILHSFLSLVPTSELTWFLYWAYVPVSLFVGITSNFLDDH